MKKKRIEEKKQGEDSWLYDVLMTRKTDQKITKCPRTKRKYNRDKICALIWNIKWLKGKRVDN